MQIYAYFIAYNDINGYICSYLNYNDMQKYADYIKKIEIDSLWSGKKHVEWELDKKVNILSGINGVGKSTILNRVVDSLSVNAELHANSIKGVKIDLYPDTATTIRYDVIRSFDRPLLVSDTMKKIDNTIVTELDWQLFKLQRKYLDYQVNVGNRIICVLQSGEKDAAEQARIISEPKRKFQDIVDELFYDTGKVIIRTENEICFSQMGERILPWQLSSGEKQLLVILLTVLIEDSKPYVLFMDEPEVSMHLDWQERLVELVLDLNPNVQIILTTHSPAVIMRGWSDRVTEVRDITDQIISGQ